MPFNRHMHRYIYKKKKWLKLVIGSETTGTKTIHLLYHGSKRWNIDNIAVAQGNHWDFVQIEIYWKREQLFKGKKKTSAFFFFADMCVWLLFFNKVHFFYTLWRTTKKKSFFFSKKKDSILISLNKLGKTSNCPRIFF